MRHIYLSIIIVALFCGCDDRLAQRQNVIDDAKSSQIYEMRNLGSSTPQFIVRKDDGSVWFYRVNLSTDKIISKAMIFSPME